jgi:hypothetical protein
MKTLSILIPSLESRDALLSALVENLSKQSGKLVGGGVDFKKIKGCRVGILSYENHEIIFAVDNKQISTGEKRNLLLDTASKDYVVGIDDDDKVPSYYVDEFLKAIQSGADCIAINGTYTCDGKNPIKWFLSKDNPNVTRHIKGKAVYLRTTNHITAVKRELALLARFPTISNGEDKGYSEALIKHLKTEVAIEKEMYHYDFISKNKEYK